ncbi:SDR family oxidoreductase [Lichenicola cladoniae]|uniref:SDR family oxidoreductase n=1 Tax=Lichenicola cladoniae TaxID=1484109 RepID=A0A6M8HUG6_9PROT|nr:SDR family oxidoreductase [Lichenicola cladoniae]NPD69443.1 SDR family oxidoreductase [Acetobacteraceae bacterium]QKE92179.1 SDR family oxidoreductase [Lichenicola cladoniae]
MYMRKLRLDGRVAVVTGGAGGIGLACVHALAEAGAHVVIADLDMTQAEAGAQAVKEAGGQASVVALDVTRTTSVKEAAQAVLARLGKVDILVCNAGIVVSEIKAEDLDDEVWNRHIDINLGGVFRCCREFGRSMLQQQRGSIINIGSMAGSIVVRPQEQAAYNASKAGVHQLTRSLAAEWAMRGVRVNAVAPTYIETPLTRFGMAKPALYDQWLAHTPMNRVGQPDEIASVVHFLASDAASLMTGSIVYADGGYTVW